MKINFPDLTFKISQKPRENEVSIAIYKLRHV